MTDVILQRGKCTYWGCKNFTQSIYCRDHRPERCRICNCLPYGSRGLTYGMCIKHYKRWARYQSPQRAKILAGERRRSAERRRKAKEAQAQAAHWPPVTLAERLEFGGWSSGTCVSPRQRLELVP